MLTGLQLQGLVRRLQRGLRVFGSGQGRQFLQPLSTCLLRAGQGECRLFALQPVLLRQPGGLTLGLQPQGGQLGLVPPFRLPGVGVGATSGKLLLLRDSLLLNRPLGADGAGLALQPHGVPVPGLEVRKQLGRHDLHALDFDGVDLLPAPTAP